MNGERILMWAAPLVATAAVGAGLDLGAASDREFAVVSAAPSGGARALAWQLATYHEVRGVREAVALSRVDVVAQADGREARWSGPTNEDGIAELSLDLPDARRASVEIRSGSALLARGFAGVPVAPLREASSAWASFARREGPVVLDVAVLGQRVASGFPASIWVHATDGATRAPLIGVSVEAVEDASLPSVVGDRTDARGWAHLVVTPMGLAVALALQARAPDGRTGDWAGALFMSPGAFEIVARDRYRPDEEPELDVVAPNLRRLAYVEVDDASGRAWATAALLTATAAEMPHARVKAPRLAPGVYWAVASSDAAGATTLGPGTSARPFVVAVTDGEGLALLARDRDGSSDPERRAACEGGGAGAEIQGRALGACLAVTEPLAVQRQHILEGVAGRSAHEARRRQQGLALGLGAIAVAVLLEGLLVVRAARRGRAKLRAAALDPEHAGALERRSSLLVSLLVALLGFALLAALLLRAA